MMTQDPTPLEWAPPPAPRAAVRPARARGPDLRGQCGGALTGVVPAGADLGRDQPAGSALETHGRSEGDTYFRVILSVVMIAVKRPKHRVFSRIQGFVTVANRRR